MLQYCIHVNIDTASSCFPVLWLVVPSNSVSFNSVQKVKIPKSTPYAFDGSIMKEHFEGKKLHRNS